MAGALPNPSQCCSTCTDTPTTAVPGPQGVAGAAGAAGTNGVNAYSTTAAGFTMPAVSGTVVVQVDSSVWMAVGQTVFIGAPDAGAGSGIGRFLVNDRTDSTHVTLLNPGDATNVAPGTVVGVGQTVSPCGPSGADGVLTGAAGGDLTGTYPSPTLASTGKGDLIADTGVVKTRLPVGTDGKIPVADSTQATGLGYQQVVPNAQTDNVIPRFDDPAGTGKPSPLQGSNLLISNSGAIQSTPSGGNARGVSAVDLQVVRSNATEVASGAKAFIGGGNNNTASGDNSVIVGGQENACAGQLGSVGGGYNNSASAFSASISGGESNLASAADATVAGGKSNTASGAQSSVAGGQSNTASAANSHIGGGTTNTASDISATVSGGDTNTASKQYTAISGGFNNTASANYASVAGGISNSASGVYSHASGNSSSAYLLGQHAHASGVFAAVGDAQTSVLVARNTTTNATTTELFLDGASVQFAIPANTLWAFKILIAAKRSTVAENAVYTIVGAIKRDAAVGTTAIVGAITKVAVAEDDATWDVTAQADAANGALQIMVTGAAGKTVKWVARVELAEITFA